MKERIYTGYAVTTPDFDANYFESYSIEDCKRYCNEGSVIVKRYKKRWGFEIKFSFHEYYKPFEFRWRWKEMNILWLHIKWGAIYCDRNEHKVFWKPE